MPCGRHIQRTRGSFVCALPAGHGREHAARADHRHAPRTYSLRLPVPRPPVTTLTARQREIVLLAADGMQNKEITQRLHLSIHTVETHRQAIARKLGTNSIALWTRHAIREGWLVT